ncbi:MAG TPA: bifunctional oligoribonuclease/PAP phosphatase NrnA [bacterium (Candidatus Stahlbacteria)]|nr:bifunctional oligoribonuclease/PAP phosphatase NrnA [Candidatus Stahlbacteria bacterium]
MSSRRDKRWLGLKPVLKKGSTLLIITHNNPDPDAISSAFGLAQIGRYFGVKPTIFYSGRISCPENRRMVGVLKIRSLFDKNVFPRNFSTTAFVDCQSGGRNHPFHRLRSDIEIDHHPRIGRKCSSISIIEPRIGATSTIIAEIMIRLGIKIRPRVATALFYGIKTDTQNLSRGTTERDLKAYSHLFNLMDKRKLAVIESPERSRYYYSMLNKGLKNSRMAGRLAYARLGKLGMFSIIPELSDLLVNIKGIYWSLVLGEVDGTAYFSIRTRKRGGNAGELARMIAENGDAGGHEEMGGGRIVKGRMYGVVNRVKAILNISGPDRPLLPSVFD